MENLRHCGPNAGPDSLIRRAALTFAMTALALLAGCTQATPPAPVAAAPPVAPVTPVPFPEAVLKAANGVFTGALANARHLPSAGSW